MTQQKRVEAKHLILKKPMEKAQRDYEGTPVLRTIAFYWDRCESRATLPCRKNILFSNNPDVQSFEPVGPLPDASCTGLSHARLFCSINAGLEDDSVLTSIYRIDSSVAVRETQSNRSLPILVMED